MYHELTISSALTFPLKQYNVSPNGCYEIALRLNGEWKIVILDDYFPLIKYQIICNDNLDDILMIGITKLDKHDTYEVYIQNKAGNDKYVING